jgi:hypothetical protein
MAQSCVASAWFSSTKFSGRILKLWKVVNGAQFDHSSESSRRIVHRTGSLCGPQASQEVNHWDTQTWTDSAASEHPKPETDIPPPYGNLSTDNWFNAKCTPVGEMHRVIRQVLRAQWRIWVLPGSWKACRQAGRTASQGKLPIPWFDNIG